MKIIRQLIKPLVLLDSLFVRPCIVFESVPAFCDNTKCVYDELNRRGYNKKYNLIWRTGPDTISCFERGMDWHIYSPKSIKQFLLSVSFVKRRNCSIYGNTIYGFKDNCEMVFYLCHGTPMKSVREYYNLPEYINFIITTSNKSSQISAYEYNVPIEKCISIGYPRNDCLTNPPKDIKTALKTECEKVIVWYPTYRQQKNDGLHLSEKPLPIVSDEEIVGNINDFAKKLNTLIVIKPHFAQDLSYFKFSELSNIKRIDDRFFDENGITSYEFVGACDALLTDYSSIYYDYTLCDKPIGLVWQDFDEYATNPGFVEDYERLTSGGEKIYCLEDLCTFIESVSKGEDKLKKQRNEICKEMNNITDGTATEKVTDFIIEKSNL